MKRLTLLGPFAALYVLAAWLTVPGFFDGFAPPSAYRWVSPPPDFKKDNQPPQSGQATAAVAEGVAQSGQVVTADGQAGLTFPTRSFEAPSGGGQVTIQVRPVASYPDLDGLGAASNVYLISASTRLISPAQVTLRFVSLRQDPPGNLFMAETSAGPWRPIGPVDYSTPFHLRASTSSLGYFVAGYPPAAAATPPAAPGGAGDSTVLLLAAGAALVVVVAGIPLVLARRRTAPIPPATAEAPLPPGRNLGGARRGSRRPGRRR